LSRDSRTVGIPKLKFVSSDYNNPNSTNHNDPYGLI